MSLFRPKFVVLAFRWSLVQMGALILLVPVGGWHDLQLSLLSRDCLSTAFLGCGDETLTAWGLMSLGLPVIITLVRLGSHNQLDLNIGILHRDSEKLRDKILSDKIVRQV
jgi:hypothetical protein